MNTPTKLVNNLTSVGTAKTDVTSTGGGSNINPATGQPWTGSDQSSTVSPSNVDIADTTTGGGAVSTPATTTTTGTSKVRPNAKKVVMAKLKYLSISVAISAPSGAL